MRRLLKAIALVASLAACLAMCGCSGFFDSLKPEESTTSVVVEEPEPQVPQIVLDVPDPADLPAETVLTDEEVEAYGEEACFTVNPISDEVFERMVGKTFKSNCTVPREELRYICVLHKNAEGETLTGEIVLHESIAEDIREIFYELYQAGYPIERMRLIDDYDANDRASMGDNNTSGFNFRLVEGTSNLSNHARGLALDVNPFYNPYVIPSTGYVSPPGAEAYANPSAQHPYKMHEGDLLYTLFKEHGFRWGGDWNSPKDYQHFEKNGAVIY